MLQRARQSPMSTADLNWRIRLSVRRCSSGCQRVPRTSLLLDRVLDFIAGLFHFVADLLRRVVYLLTGFLCRTLFASGKSRDRKTQYDRRCDSRIELHVFSPQRNSPSLPIVPQTGRLTVMLQPSCICHRPDRRTMPLAFACPCPFRLSSIL